MIHVVKNERMVIPPEGLIFGCVLRDVWGQFFVGSFLGFLPLGRFVIMKNGGIVADSELTSQDVQRLLQEDSPEVRAHLAVKIAQRFDQSNLSEKERDVAEQIFRLMVRDAEVRVREALSLHLKDNPMLPHDVAVSLARDVERVSVPLLQSSDVLTDSDLIEIVRGQASFDALKAIAGRHVVSSGVADELVQKADADVAATLAANEGAQLSEKSLLEIIGRFGDDEQVHTPLALRAHLPLTVCERLVHHVSEVLKDHILKHHELSPDLATDLVMHTRERAVITLSTESSEDDVERLVYQMAEHERLTSSIIVRAVCMGDLSFFEHALACKSGLSVVNVRRLIHDTGVLGLKAIFDKCSLPSKIFPAVRAAVDAIAETGFDGGNHDIERYQRRVLERVLTQYGDLGVDFEEADLDYLLARIEKMPSFSDGS